MGTKFIGKIHSVIVNGMEFNSEEIEEVKIDFRPKKTPTAKCNLCGRYKRLDDLACDQWEGDFWYECVIPCRPEGVK